MPLWDLAKEWELPVGRGKLSRGLLPSTSVLGSSCSPGNVPSRTSPELVYPTGCAWAASLPSHGSGLGVSASSPPSAGIIVQEGSLRWVLPGSRDISMVLFLFPALILDGKACGTSGWVGKLSRQ